MNPTWIYAKARLVRTYLRYALFSTRMAVVWALISAIWNMSAFKQKLRIMPNPTRLTLSFFWRLQTVFAWMKFHVSDWFWCVLLFALFLTAYEENECIEITNLVGCCEKCTNRLFFSFDSTCTQFKHFNERRALGMNNSLMCVTGKSRAYAIARTAHTLLIYWNR